MRGAAAGAGPGTVTRVIEETTFNTSLVFSPLQVHLLLLNTRSMLTILLSNEEIGRERPVGRRRMGNVFIGNTPAVHRHARYADRLTDGGQNCECIIYEDSWHCRSSLASLAIA